MTLRKKVIQSALTLAVLATAAVIAPANAQDNWPNKPVKIIVPSSPGGGTDIFGRLIAQALSDELRQPFVVDNRAGASGNIGAAATAKSPPDGYTFMVTSNASIAIGPGLYTSLPFDVERDFTPIAQGVFAPMVVVAHAGSGIRTLAQLIERGKQKPGESFYGSAGVGTSPFLGVKMLESLSGARFEHVPYKGVAPAYQDLLSGRLQFMYPDLASIQPFIRSGQVVPLAINRETDLLPNVPSFEKAGVNGMTARTTFSVMGPAGVPPQIVAKMSITINTVMKSPAIASRLKELALIPIFDTPAEFAASLKKERDYWAVFISRNGIKPD